MTFTFTLWELVFVCSLGITVGTLVTHYIEQVWRYWRAKRRSDSLRRSQCWMMQKYRVTPINDDTSNDETSQACGSYMLNAGTPP